MEINVKEVGWVEKLFSRESDLVEDESLFVEGLGWVIFRVENNAGSITVWVSKEKIEAIPYCDEEKYKQITDTLIADCRVAYFGSYGNEEGIGAFFTNLVDDTYTRRIEFSTFEESFKEMERYLNTFRV